MLYAARDSVVIVNPQSDSDTEPSPSPRQQQQQQQHKMREVPVPVPPIASQPSNPKYQPPFYVKAAVQAAAQAAAQAATKAAAEVGTAARGKLLKLQIGDGRGVFPVAAVLIAALLSGPKTKGRAGLKGRVVADDFVLRK